ncbi:MAG TPA: molybdopterin-dependent oxidoreductase [Burkholderiales bacterium]|nr:molybdopterin-dependent oxidoreductase [Burkholderiales bacterium]
MTIASIPLALLETKSTCPYCGVGCGVIIEHDGTAISGVRGDPDHPANFGRLCTKGTTLHLSARPENRALTPEMRVSRHSPRQPVSWDKALDACADTFARVIREHGPDAVGFYISGQLLTEDYYVFNKLAKGLIGTNNVDTNSRLCMSSAVAGYKQTLGADAPPACYEDLDTAEVLFIAGSNMAFAHPVLYRRIEEAKAKKGDALKVIVVDPRKTDTAREADLHLQILPGTDIALFNGMLNAMLWEGLTDAAYIAEHTAGFDALKEAVREMTPAAAARICGVPEADIHQAALWFGRSAATLSLYCQGLNQSAHGTHNNAALINLHLATGQIGKPGAGPFSLTGQPNAMGGREVGGLANLISAHRDMNNPAHRAEVAKLWGVDEVPATPGKTAVEMFDAVKSGQIKALWIACTNPAQSMPDLHSVREALEAAELVVLQEAFSNTDTAAYADVLLPASTWGEKHGTVTNSERRITRVAPAVAAPGQARDDWDICVDFARRLGERLGRGELARRLFDYASPEAIWNEHRESTRGRDLDITGLSYAILEERGPQQWPMPTGAAAGQQRLYADGRFPTADGRARFVAAKHAAVQEPVNAAYPLALNTGRLRDQWHGMSRTGLVARLFSHVEEPLLSMDAADLARRGLAPGDLAEVSSRRGRFVVRVEASDTVRLGQAFMPMHWGAQFMRGLGVNALTSPAIDPYSKQPELKAAAIEVKRALLPHRVVAMRRFEDAASAALLTEALKPLLDQFDYATLTLAGREEVLVSLRGYCAEPVPEAVLDRLDTLLDLTEPARVMRYVDARRRVEKAARIDDGLMTSVCLSGETAAADWLKGMMLERATLEAVRPWILAPVSRPPQGSMARGVIICNCLNVAESEIRADAAAGLDFGACQAKRQCGTSCGSCLPEVKRIISQTPRTEPSVPPGGQIMEAARVLPEAA